MPGILFDTHKAINDLKNAGFKEEQAEALVEFEKSKDISNSATREDLNQAILELKVWTLKVMAGQVALIVALIKLL